MKKPDRIYLIAKADDVGSNASANRAFHDAFKRGILRNGVIMTVCEASAGAANLFRDEKGFCMGLHMTLNAEWDRVKWGPVLPAGQVPSLVDCDGHFFPTTQRLHDNRPRIEEALAELQAQLDRARALGLDIRFADEHMGFSWAVEGLREELGKWCEKNGILHGINGFKRLPEAEAAGDPVERFLSRLKAAEPGVYCHHFGHPAYDSPEMRLLGHKGYENVADEREWDRRTLMEERVVHYCRENNIVPVTLTEAIDLIS